MTAIDFKEIPSPQKGPNRDQFELFSEDFLKTEGFVVVEGVDRGPDGGRDLIVDETRIGPGGKTVVRWLVSCKHQAHSGTAVSPNDENNIRDRLELHGCQGFIAFYSTVPTSGLSEILRSLPPKFGVIIYNPAAIEEKLTGAANFRNLAARYFPKSYNAWVQNSQHVVNTPPLNDPHKIRNKYFLREPHTNLKSALEEAKSRNVRLFLIIYDQDHPSHSKLDYSLGYFMEYQTTKRLVDQHFVALVGSTNDPELAGFVPKDDPLENALCVVVENDGRIVRSEGVYANPDEGYKRVRQLVQ